MKAHHAVRYSLQDGPPRLGPNQHGERRCQQRGIPGRQAHLQQGQQGVLGVLVGRNCPPLK